ncbi:MAG TPA: DUF4910 domain-containing protein, partial [Bacilli bacterium]|nr:DUF4910 domain-containing protein [Bacilli bacterium]
ENVDVKGKLVLTTGLPHRIHDIAVRKFGAAGIVLDTMTEFLPFRRREDMMDAVLYLSYWWHDEEETGFGFMVSPRRGEQLKKLCAQGPVKVFARVDAELYPGEMENIEAFIPGETEEEVLLVSHLCHPKPGANDNASGPSTLLETARSLQKLIADGTLPKPRRGIRFLMMPEMTGTHAYVHMHPERIKRTVAALNLDMVGGDQRKTSGPLTVEKPSRAMPSYVAELAYGIFDEVAQDVKNFTGTQGYSQTNYVLTAFSGGSDHYILADPSVGIPCPMMITWPDKTYHTSIDTVENIDPKLMEKVAVTAGAYLTFLANAELPDLLMLAGRMSAHFAAEMERQVGAYVDGKASLSVALARLQFLQERQEADLRALERLVPPAQVEAWQEQLGKKLALLAAHGKDVADQLHTLAAAGVTGQVEPNGAGDATEAAEASAQDPLLQNVFVRRNPGPIDLLSHMSKLPEDERADFIAKAPKAGALHSVMVLLQYWLDGKRTLQEAIHAVEMEAGLKDVPNTLEYVRLLLKLELLEEVK